MRLEPGNEARLVHFESWADRDDTHDPIGMAAHARGTFWFVLPSLPMFLLIPALLGRAAPFWLTLLLGCMLTTALNLAMTWIGSHFGLRL